MQTNFDVVWIEVCVRTDTNLDAKHSTPARIEEFGKAIVRRCAEIVKPMGDYCGGHGEAPTPRPERCAEQLLKHYGIDT